MRINNKREFYERAELGLCGNTPRTWRDYRQFWADRANGDFPRDVDVGLRTLVPGDPRGIARVSPHNAVLRMKFSPGVWYVSEIPPGGSGDDGRGLQGELSWVNGQWWLYYTHRMGYMRSRLRESGRHAHGWPALRLLRGHLTPGDYDMVMDLFDWYTDGVDYPTIEFANFRTPWGRLNRNCIIWEIRNGY